MLLDYGTQLSYDPIPLSIGLLKKPLLRDISRIGFNTFNTFEFFMKCTPESFYTKALSESGGIEIWESLPDDKKDTLTMYDLIESDNGLQELYVSMFDFFFIENIKYIDGYFVLYKTDTELIDEKIPVEAITGIIAKKNFDSVLDVIQQVCCIYDNTKDSKDEEIKFKNNLAKELYERMQKAIKEREARESKKADKNLSMPNIISSVASMHPNYNLINVWDLTIFQLLDAFRRIQDNSAYDIQRVRVSVWGDEKKQFDPSLWHKNYYDT